MATCRECRWSDIDWGNPMKGKCLVGKHEAGAKETTSGVAQSVIPGKLITLLDPACDKFETKPSHAQRLKEGL